MPTSPCQPVADVLVIGGGLAGSAAALVLARAGRQVTLLERDTAPRHKVCGEFLSDESLGILSALGIDICALGALSVATVRLAGSGRAAEASLPFAAQSLTRRSLDECMLQAAATAGVSVLRGATVEALDRHPQGHWQAALRAARPVAGRVAILATGKHDLRGYPRLPGPQSDLVAFKMYLQLTPAQSADLRGAVELLLQPGGYTGLQLVEGGSANLTALIRRSRLPQLGGWPGLLEELRRMNPHARQRLNGARFLLPKPLALGAIPYGYLRHDALAPSLYAIGDQAAVIPSFTGDGMSLALTTGLLAARAILDGRDATSFHKNLHRSLGAQVRRATLLSRLLVRPSGQHALLGAARVWPAGLQHAARLTRVPGSVLRGLLSPR